MVCSNLQPVPNGKQNVLSWTSRFICSQSGSFYGCAGSPAVAKPSISSVPTRNLSV